MWISNAIDIEAASDNAKKLVLLVSALKVGIFEAIVQEKDIASLRRELQADERALYIVLEALCGLGYVNKRYNRYVIADMVRPFLLKRGKDYIGFPPYFFNAMRAWLALPDIIRGVKTERTEDVAAFMDAMVSRPDKIVEEVVYYCLKKKKDAREVLDLGGGPGRYSRGFASRDLNVVLYDISEIIDYVSNVFKLENTKNLLLKKGDFTKIEFEMEFSGKVFDIIFMGNICHIYSEEENKKLIKRVSNLLEKNGMVAIEDFLRGRSPLAEMFAVNMLVNTEGGNAWTEAQYTEWLEDAGFCKIEVIDLANKSKQLITAFRE